MVYDYEKEYTNENNLTQEIENKKHAPLPAGIKWMPAPCPDNPNLSRKAKYKKQEQHTRLISEQIWIQLSI